MSEPSADVQRLLFVDLDDTLFHSARKNTVDRARVGYVDGTGVAAGFCTSAQAQLYEWFSGAGTVIPVTMRSLEVLERVVIDFPSWKVCCGGGVILNAADDLDLQWHALMEQELAAHQELLSELDRAWGEAARADGIDIRHRVVGHGGLGMYLSLRHAQRVETPFGKFIARHRGALVPAEWRLHVTRYSASLGPPALSKGAAVSYLKARLPHVLSVAVGDSGADFSFMARCDFAMLPTSSHLFKWLGDTLTAAES